MGLQVTFYGCDELGDADKTTIIYDPMRIITTGVAGVQTMKGGLAFNLEGLTDAYTEEEMLKTIENGAASFPRGNGSASPDFNTCFTCLLYAKAKRDGSFLRLADKALDSKCAGCYSAYCYGAQQT